MLSRQIPRFAARPRPRPRRTLATPIAGLLLLGAAAAPGRAQPCFAERVIAEGVPGAASVFVVDLDGDNDIDVLAASSRDDTVAWYENDGGSPPGFASHIITDGALGAAAVFAADVDGDGDTDVLSASPYDSTVAWYVNDGGKAPVFTRHVITDTRYGVRSVSATDLDGDGDTDIVGAGAWFENDGGEFPAFTEHPIAELPANIESVCVADVDGDGNIDVIAGIEGYNAIENTITWYQNSGEIPPVFSARTVNTLEIRAESVAAADVNGDGDTDILLASDIDGTVAWCENNGASSPIFAVHVISSETNGAESVFAIDVDGDGDMDALSASSFGGNSIAWYESDGEATPGFTTHIITDHATGAQSVAAADVDGDGDIDVLSAQSVDYTIEWYEQAGTANLTTSERFSHLEIAIQAALPGDVIRADSGAFQASCLESLDFLDKPITVVSTGDAEVGSRVTTVLADEATLAADLGDSIALAGPVSVPAGAGSYLAGGEVELSGPLDLGNGGALWIDADSSLVGRAALSEIVISTEVSYTSAVVGADMDGDGVDDVLCVSSGFWSSYWGVWSDSEIVWYESHAGSGPSGVKHAITAVDDGPQSVAAADIDGDGDTDVVSASIGSPSYSDGTIAWYESDGGTPPTFQRRVITKRASNASSVFATDIDRDGDIDLACALAGTWDGAQHVGSEIIWYENDGSVPPDFSERGIASKDDSARSVHAIDVDGDGDIDVLAASARYQSTEGTIAWYENDGGSPPSFEAHVITSEAGGAISVFGTDVDGDGDADVLSAAASSEAVVWYENNGGAAPSFTRRIISTRPNSVRDVFAADVDSDGDADVFSASAYDNMVAWFENDGRVPPAFTERVVTPKLNGASSVSATDVDGDGDVDVFASGSSSVAWYENLQTELALNSTVLLESLGDLGIVNRSITLGRDTLLAAGATLSVDRASALGGSGTAEAPVVASAGVVRPAPGRRLTILGDYVQRHDDGVRGLLAGALRVEYVPGLAFPRLDVAGEATLDGTLRLTMPDGFVPRIGQSFTVLTAGSFGGSRFDTALLPNIGDDRFLAVTYDEGASRAEASVSLTVVELDGDVVLDPQAAADSGAEGVPRGATLADLDLDGDPDLLIALPDATSPATAPGSVVVLYNADDGDPGNGWEGFGDTLQIFDGVGVNPSSVAVGTLDGDAQPDIAVANRGDPADPSNDTVSILLVSDPSPGGFSTSAIFTETVGDGPADVIIADLDGDGRNDIATANEGDHSVTYAPNEGPAIGPSWERVDPVPIALPEDGECPLSIRPGDTDAMLTSRFLATTNAGDDSVGLVQINPDRSFLVLPNLPVGEGPLELIVADLDGDGLDDIATVNRAGSSLSIALNETAGATLSMGPSSEIPIDSAVARPRSLASGDLDADGDADLAVLADNVVRVLRNDLAGGQLAFTPIADQPAGRQPLLVRSADLNADGRDDVVTVARSTGGARSGDRAPGESINTLLAAPTPSCPGDIDGDGSTDVFDFAIFADVFGLSTEDPQFDPRADLNGDGVVNAVDFVDLADHFGCESR